MHSNAEPELRARSVLIPANLKGLSNHPRDDSNIRALRSITVRTLRSTRVFMLMPGVNHG